MAQSPFEKPTVYHSALVAESKRDPLEITMLDAKPQASKFPNQNDRMRFRCMGDEHYYTVENDRCAEALSGYKGETILIRATGREDDADIEVVEVVGRGAPERRQEPPPRREARREEPRRESHREREPERTPERQPEDRKAIELREFKKAKKFGAQCGVLMDIAMRFAEPLASAHLKSDQDGTRETEDVRALAVTLFIEMKSMIDISKLPTSWIDTKAQGVPERQPEPKREEPPARQERRPESAPDPDEAEEDNIPF